MPRSASIPPSVLRRDRLGERAVERRHVGELDPVADAALVEVPVGEEAELERRDRALDRHVDDVDDHAAAVERGERRAERGRALEVVEGEDLLHPARAEQALGLLGDERARRWRRRARRSRATVPSARWTCWSSTSTWSIAELTVVDAVVQLLAARPDDVLGVGEAERHEQQTRVGRRGGRPGRRR